MARVLAVDTSSPGASYAVIQGEKVLAALSTASGALQSQTFFANLSTLLNLAQLEIKEIDALAVATGPGSFTGLRVGLAAVKGLAYTLGRPSVGVNSIDALALSAGVTGLVLVMIEAGRGEVYGGLRRISSDGMIVPAERDRVGLPSSLLTEFREALRNNDGSLSIVGDGADRHQEALRSFASELGIETLMVSHLNPALKSWQLKLGHNETSVAIGRHAAKLIGTGNWPEVLAYYIRPSDAEIKMPRSATQSPGHPSGHQTSG